MNKAAFSIGTVVRHKLFDYYGVIYDVDPSFAGSDEWYEQMARTRPPKDKPWYRVLVDQQDIETYVAEKNLECCPLFREISHPLTAVYFEGYDSGHYIPRITAA